MLANPSHNNNDKPKKYEQLPNGFRIVPSNEGPNKISLIEDVSAELRSIVTNERFDTINERLHGAFRQTATGCFELLGNDDDRVKAGSDRVKKYQKVLIERGLDPVDWTTVRCEVVLLAIYKRNTTTGDLDYKGLAVFAERNDAGRELLEKLKKKPLQSASGDAGFVNTPTVTSREEKPKKSTAKSK
jgi:hypothetical protein